MIEKFYIVKDGSEYVVKSESGKTLGRYKTRGEAEHRLKQIEYWKHHNKSSVFKGIV